MKCQWCNKSFPNRKGRFCGTCYPPNHRVNRHDLYNADLKKAIDATMLGLLYHPKIRDVFSEDTSRDVSIMLTTLANTAFKLGQKQDA